MSFLGAPSVPDAGQVATQQSYFNNQAAAQQQKTNMVNQQTPFGSLNYSQDPTSGAFSSNLQLSPQQQQILNTQQGTVQSLGNTGQSLANSLQGMYSQAPNFDPSALTNKVMGWGQQYMQPIFNQQQSNLDANLQNQGITPGSEAFNNAQNLQSRNVNNAYEQLLMQAEPQAFSQAVQSYQVPLQTAQSLIYGPQQPNLVNTPQAQIQPPNYQSAAQSQYQNQMGQFSGLLSGLGTVANVGLGMFGL